MKIVVVACNAKYIHSNLAVYSLQAYAGEYARYLQLKEYTINQKREEILGDIYACAPDVVFFSCYIWNISLIRELLWELSQILPRVPLWVGGPEVSWDARAFLEENPHVTGIIKGEGEETFRELLRYYTEGKGALDQIAGISYRQEEILENPLRESIDLNRIPFPYREAEDFAHRIIYYESSRGCPFSCSYCLSSIDKKLRFRDLKLVKEELQFFLEKGVPQVKFVDRTFNCRPSHAKEIWRFLLEHDNGRTNFHFEIAADLLDEEELELLAAMRPGLVQLESGVQSTNPKTLAAICRRTDIGKLKKAVQSVKKAGNIHQHLDLIAGLPYEDLKSFRQSFTEVYRLGPQKLQLGFLKILKGSAMHRQAEAYHYQYRRQAPYEVLSTPWLSYEGLWELKQVEAMVEIYYNSGQFLKTLEFLEKYFPEPYDFYFRLGEFYCKKGYRDVSHSRLGRYEILREFIKEQAPRTPLWELQEALLYDLYLRENIKSRPVWAGNAKEYQAVISRYKKIHKIAKTAHIEVFRKRTLLFEYEQRDPLTNNGSVREIEL